MAKILISYVSKSGHTRKMAEAIANGVKKSGCEFIIKETKDTELEDLLDADAIVFGSPTYYGSMAADLKRLLETSVKYHGKLAGKIGGAFTSSGMIGGGNETTLMSIAWALLIHGMIIQGNADIGHFGPVAIGAPDERATEECTKYGERIGRLTNKIIK